MNFFTVSILTPERVIARELPAASLLIPTIRGQINVLPEHTHLITQLAIGELSIFGGADDSDRHFAISTGVCKILGKKISILAHTAEEEREIDGKRAELALQNALQRLNDGQLSDLEIKKFRNKVERARLRIQLAKGL